MLRRMLDWGDLYYLPVLISETRPARSRIPAATVDRIAAHNRFDEELFRFGETLLDEAIAAQGPDFAVELQAFKALNAQHIARWTGLGAIPSDTAQLSKK
jgi:hypothetical protein